MCVFRSRRVVLPDGERPAAIHVRDGRITAVTEYDEIPAAADLVDAGDLTISPGLVDTHVHVNEPGRADWEGFDTATRAAAAGGVTTIVDMPLNSIPATIDVAGFERKREAARGRCHVDVGFWGGVVPGNSAHLEPLASAGVRGFKCFLAPSGVEEFPPVSESSLRDALRVLSRARAVPLLVHAELPGTLRPPGNLDLVDRRSYRTYLATRPESAEVEAIELLARLAAEYRVPTHVVHLSSAGGVAAVAAAQARGLPVSAETCPHYLTWTADEVPDGATAFKCAPPIRTGEHRDALWVGLRRRTCGMVVTDHSPAPPSMKCLDTGDFLAAWGGISSLELSLAAVWTAALGRGLSTVDLSRWMSRAPAALCGLAGRKGTIVTGAEADLVVWDPDLAFTVVADRLEQRHKSTPYHGRTLRGSVYATFVRGIRVWQAGKLDQGYQGRLL
ncbi:MAG: allantoinase AllB [Luteitalea sp.]|nr:allantoinase AllB [Luteitalea sp.]